MAFLTFFITNLSCRQVMEMKNLLDKPVAVHGISYNELFKVVHSLRKQKQVSFNLTTELLRLFSY